MTAQLEQEPVAYRQWDSNLKKWHYKDCKEDLNAGMPYFPLYASPPNAKAIRAAALLEVVELIKGHAEAHSSKVGWHLVSRIEGDVRGLAYTDAIPSLIGVAPTREDIVDRVLEK